MRNIRYFTLFIIILIFLPASTARVFAAANALTGGAVDDGAVAGPGDDPGSDSNSMMNRGGNGSDGYGNYESRQPSTARERAILCSEDMIPANMAIIATGDSDRCMGGCRSREVERVRGEIMIICAQQAIPRGYTVESITTTPQCRCLGDEDNAYVIRKDDRSEADWNNAPPDQW